jgi:hypothetical protein
MEPTHEERMAFLARVEIALSHAREREALGWVVVVTDTELNESLRPSSCYGVFLTAEAALVVAGQFDADRLGGVAEGWRHDVIPLFEHSDG